MYCNCEHGRHFSESLVRRKEINAKAPDAALPHGYREVNGDVWVHTVGGTYFYCQKCASTCLKDQGGSVSA